MDPITISMAVSAIGSVLGGIFDFFGGGAKQKAAQAAALQARQEAGVESSIALEEGDRVIASAATRAAASGGGITGSASAVLSDLSRQAMFNARSAVYKGETEARARIYEGKVAKAQGDFGLVKGVFQGASTALGAFGQKALDAKLSKAPSLGSGLGATDGSGFSDFNGGSYLEAFG